MPFSIFLGMCPQLEVGFNMLGNKYNLRVSQ